MQNVYIIVSCWLMVFMITCITVPSAEFINHLLMQNHSDCTDERGIDDDEEEEEDDDEDYSVLAPTPKRRKLASLIALDASLKSGLYPEFKGVEGPLDSHGPESSDAFDYLEDCWWIS